jgi:hypothetical protein
VRPALLDAAEHAVNDEARALALESFPTDAASADEVARVAAWLADQSAQVRASAARALGASALRDRALVVERLESALATERNEDAASMLIESGLRAGRGGADTLLARFEQTPIVRACPALAREITDYRSSLGAGETDPRRIVAEHEAREAALLR